MKSKFIENSLDNIVRDRYSRSRTGYFGHNSSTDGDLTNKIGKKQNLNRFRFHSWALVYASLVPIICIAFYALEMWIGYALLYVWLSLLVLGFEVVCIFLRDTNGNLSMISFSKADWTLFAILVLIYIAITANLCMDFVPENSSAEVLVFPKFLTTIQCQELISAAEETASTSSRSLSRGWQTSRHKYYPTTDLPLYSIRNRNMTITSGQSMDLVSWLNRTIIEDRIFPLLRRYYSLPLPRYELYMKDAFIVKYDATAKGFQRHLSTHQDSSLLSFHIALSSPRSTGDLLPDARQAPRQSQSLRSSLKPPSNSSSSSLSPPQPQASLSEETKEKERERGKETEQQEGFLSGGTHFTLLDLTYRPDRGSLLTHPSRVYHAGAEIEGGRRYLLVGFVQVRHPDLLSSFWRKYGAVARCMSLREQAASNSTGTKASSLQSATHTAQGDGDNQIGMNKDIFKQGFRSINTS